MGERNELFSTFRPINWRSSRVRISWVSQHSLENSSANEAEFSGILSNSDFLNGWDVDILQQAVTECTAESGVIEEYVLLFFRQSRSTADQISLRSLFSLFASFVDVQLLSFVRFPLSYSQYKLRLLTHSRCPVFDFFDWEIEHTPEEMSCLQSPAISEQVLGTLDALPGCNPIDYGPGDVTVCNEENPPSIEGTVEISGYVLNGNKSLEVSTSNNGGASAGSSSTGGSETSGSTGALENDETSSTSNSSGSNAPSDADKDSASSPLSSTTSSSPSIEASTTSSSAFERNKALILCLIVALPVVVFVTIVLCCKFSCGRTRKKTLARERAEDEDLNQEGELKQANFLFEPVAENFRSRSTEQALQEPLTTDSDDSSDSEESQLDRRRR